MQGLRNLMKPSVCRPGAFPGLQGEVSDQRPEGELCLSEGWQDTRHIQLQVLTFLYFP
jgi:hypothetical protein